MTGNSPLETRPERPPQGQKPAGQRLAAGALAVGMQAAAFAALFWPHPAAPPPREEPALVMVKVAEEKPQSPGPPSPDQGAPDFAQPAAPQAAPPRLVFARTAIVDNSDLLSASQIAGASSADGEGGGGGGDCNTAHRVQQALQRDPLVRAAVENAHRLGQAVMLWDGDWVRSGSEDGKGLSAVREAITWELAFAPAA